MHLTPKQKRNSMKVIIAGGRNYSDYTELCNICDAVLKGTSDIEIVSGTARGADSLGERYALERGHDLKKFPADWSKYGKSAGYIRNKQMAEYADGLIAFWDGESKGTLHMINLAKERSLKVRIYNFILKSIVDI